MVELSHVSLGIAGLAGSLFIAYAIYFDRKRRSAPDFKKKLRERRELSRKNRSKHIKSDQLPDLKDHKAVQDYFLQQIQLGEELLANRQLDEGLEHFGRAITVCGQPQKLLEVLQSNMPAPVFAMLLQRLPEIHQRFMSQQPNLIQMGEDIDLE